MKNNGCFYNIDDIVGKSRAVKDLKRLIRLYAKSDGPVLIEGESGTGKELVAQSIHSLSKRQKKPFVALNVAALPVELVESELFGYKKGAFTGSLVAGYPGKVLAAEGGTLFLDEIGELPPAVQPKLLRLLQEGTILPLGGKREQKVDVRIIAATNKDLKSEIKEGFFREDLFYRLHLFYLRTPPLRKRKEDIPLLLDYFSYRFLLRYNLKERFSFSKNVIQVLLKYKWPGNVRELQNFAERELWFALEKGERVIDHIPDYILNHLQYENEGNYFLDEKSRLKEALQRFPRKSEAAKALGISRSTLYRKLKKYGLEE